MPTAVTDDTPMRLQTELLSVMHDLSVSHIRLNRPSKRNALSDTLIESLRNAFSTLPEATKAVVLSGEGEHFCAGLDLAEMSDHDVAGGILHSRGWHAAFDQLQFGRVPVIAVLHGAVVGGGLELASAAHIRVGETSAFYALPEGQRGLFVGGGGSARIPRLVGVPCMTDMMMTGRVLSAEEGQQRGISQYLVEPGLGVKKALELAHKVATNAPLSNFAVMHALPRIADLSQSDGLFVESLMAAIAQGDGAAKGRMRAFLDGRAGKVKAV